jgi:hypothetical protein
MAKAARKRKLKVYRTPIGFHDAYVAAPSQKAALEAWGSDTNLFARGAAEEVSDEALVKAPLEQPGVVFRRLRGGKAEQMEALGKEARKRAASGTRASPGTAGMTKRKKRPSRAELDEAEEALDALEKAQRREAAALEKKQQQLERERRELERRHARETEAAEKKARAAREDYERAMEEWEGG